MIEETAIPQISVVILSCNRLEDLSRNLQTLLPGVRSQNSEIVVVDNASADGSVEMLKNLASEWPELKVVLNTSNRGVGGGRNDGFQAARGEFLVYLDDDASISPEQLCRIPALFVEFPRAGILTFRVRHPSNHAWECNHGDAVKVVANFHGAGHAFRSALFATVGYLDEGCTYGAEELDMSIRAHAQGFETTYVPEIVVDHNKIKRAAAIDTDRRLRWVYNYIRVLYKHFPPRTAAVFTRRYLVRFMAPALARGKAALAAGILQAAAKGKADGRRAYAPLPEATLQFYLDPTLRPDFGNSPLAVRFRELNAARKATLASKKSASAKTSTRTVARSK